MRVYRYPSTFAQKGVSRGRNLATEGVLAFSTDTNSRPQDSSLCYPACFAQNAFSAPGHKYTLMLPHCVALGTPPRAQMWIASRRCGGACSLVETFSWIVLLV
ncbi:hypothetical protein Bbelb_412440 [Branchiostoma belcheri]|nr:hypothetical protein Bbelb_412440 [Branchiostoma belcheri]